MEFKVGDWVKFNNPTGDGTVTKIINIDKSFKHPYELKGFYGSRYGDSDFKHWQPKEGEWVACGLSETKDEFWVMKYRKEDIENLIRLNPHEEVFIEPFIGEIPSFLKESR